MKIVKILSKGHIYSSLSKVNSNTTFQVAVKVLADDNNEYIVAARVAFDNIRYEDICITWVSTAKESSHCNFYIAGPFNVPKLNEWILNTKKFEKTSNAWNILPSKYCEPYADKSIIDFKKSRE